ncbi:superoxide dismutase family protein [Arsenophonus sp.]|uniref:superoxide dismutase family protein n=1 Tax=Arsenophonus sp. TaxID=1872640 RepID=UPI00285C8345|nr:superoxide dismutase family protein [Arsenophonus sp.]MDR5610856.1 superoxide dismutase family protein [Arsenophonus sp.]MDR5614691.1 superoxide dismutase family protein [Arsenophonus sp.]
MKLKMLLIMGTFFAATSLANTMIVPMNIVTKKDNGQSVGEIKITETKFGLLFTPKLQGLAPGIHGFHVHEYPSCDALQKDGKLIAAGKAGGHFDPNKTAQHKGSADYAILAPRLKSISQIKHRALIIHEGGDNYSDHPETLGGGGLRVVCGIIK